MIKRNTSRYRAAILGLDQIEDELADKQRYQLLGQRLVHSCESALVYLRCIATADSCPPEGSGVLVGLADFPTLPRPEETELLEDLVEAYEWLVALRQECRYLPTFSRYSNLSDATAYMRQVAGFAKIRLKVHRGVRSQFHVGPIVFPRPIDTKTHRLWLNTALAIELSLVFRRFTARLKTKNRHRFANQTFGNIPPRTIVAEIDYGQPCWKHIAQFLNSTFDSDFLPEKYRVLSRIVNGKQVADRVGRYVSRNPEIKVEKWRLPSASRRDKVIPTFG